MNILVAVFDFYEHFLTSSYLFIRCWNQTYCNKSPQVFDNDLYLQQQPVTTEN